MGYRETLMDCFASRGILPSGVMALSEDTLLWRAPNRNIPPIDALSFRELRFNGDPSIPASAGELERQARALGDVITAPQNLDEFGLTAPGSGDADPAAIQSIRTARRVGPDGQVLFDLIAEVTQRRMVVDPQTGVRAKLMGGCTVVIGPRGEIRYVISKHIGNQSRLDRQLRYQRESPEMWTAADGSYRLLGQTTALVHR